MPKFAGQMTGTLYIHVSGVDTFKVNVDANDSLNTVLNKITAANSKLSASLNDEGFIQIQYNGETTGISITDTGNFAEFYGLLSTSSSQVNSAITEKLDQDIKVNPGKSTLIGGISGITNSTIFDEQMGGYFDIFLGNNKLGTTITYDSTDNVQTILEKIRNNGAGLTADIIDGRIVITAQVSSLTPQSISVVEGAGNWTTLSGTITTNSSIVVSGSATAGNSVVTTIKGGNSINASDKLFTGTIQIGANTISTANKTIQEVVDAINNLGLSGVSASITAQKFAVTV